MLFLFSYDISIKVIGYERENNEFALFREDGSAAESPGGNDVGKVRPGAKRAKKLQMRVEPR